MSLLLIVFLESWNLSFVFLSFQFAWIVHLSRFFTFLAELSNASVGIWSQEWRVDSALESNCLAHISLCGKHSLPQMASPLWCFRWPPGKKRARFYWGNRFWIFSWAVWESWWRWPGLVSIATFVLPGLNTRRPTLQLSRATRSACSGCCSTGLTFTPRYVLDGLPVSWSLGCCVRCLGSQVRDLSDFWSYRLCGQQTFWHQHMTSSNAKVVKKNQRWDVDEVYLVGTWLGCLLSSVRESRTLFG